MGKYTVFCRKSGASWGIFVANQGQVGRILLQIRGKLENFCCKSGATCEIFVANQGQVDFFARLFFVVHGFQPEGETAAFVDFRFHGEASAEAFGDNTAY